MNQTLTIRTPGETIRLWGNLWTVVAVGIGVLWLRDWAGKIEIIAYEQPDRTQQPDLYGPALWTQTDAA